MKIITYVRTRITFASFKLKIQGSTIQFYRHDVHNNFNIVTIVCHLYGLNIDVEVRIQPQSEAYIVTVGTHNYVSVHNG